MGDFIAAETLTLMFQFRLVQAQQVQTPSVKTLVA